MQEGVKITRRELLQTSAALGASVLVVGGAAVATDKAYAQNKKQQEKNQSVQYGFLVGVTKCVGCERCIEACRRENHLTDDTPDRRRVSRFDNEKGKHFYISVSCMHCADPSCMKVCPAGAISKGDGGVVRVDPKKCIGCKYCFQACPYEVPRYNSKAMDKCDCCMGSGVALGEEPYCVQACKFGALSYGPLDELQESFHGEPVPIAQENNPSCLIIGSKKGGARSCK